MVNNSKHYSMIEIIEESMEEANKGVDIDFRKLADDSRIEMLITRNMIENAIQMITDGNVNVALTILKQLNRLDYDDNR